MPAPLTTSRFDVLVNDDGRFGLHPCAAPLPAGWAPAGFSGAEDECVQWLERSRPGGGE